MRPESSAVEISSPATDSTRSAHAAIVLLTALILGVADAALVVFRLGGAGGAFEFVPARIWIVSPIVWMVIAALAAAAGFLFQRRWSAVITPILAVALFVLIRLRAHPALLLAALALVGCITAVAGMTLQEWARRSRLRALTTSIALVVVCAMVAAPRRSKLSPAGAAAASDAPNVIVVFLDTVRYDAIFDRDGRVRGDLPTLSRLHDESTVFTHAYAPAPWTLPAHLAAVTGLRPDELGVSFDSQVYQRSEPTLAERYRERGYRTAAVISNSFLNAGSGIARGFDTFEQAEAALDICRTAPGVMADAHWPWFAASVCNWTASAVTGRALRLMIDEARPFFLMLNYMDAHDPYYVERGCEGNGYQAAIRCLDRRLAPIVDWRSPRRPTVLVLLSDHGEQFGEHGLVRHGNSLFVQLLHVPLMIRGSSAPETRANAAPLSIAALPALLDWPGTARPNDPVASLLHPPAAANDPSQWSALDGSWHLIVDEDGQTWLYDLASDPLEERNVIRDAAADPAIARLYAAIETMRRSPEPDLRRFRSLGYVH